MIFSFVAIGLGFFIRWISVKHLKGEFNSLLRFPNKFVCSGIYAYVRHPCYTGTMFIIAGLCGCTFISVAVTGLTYVFFLDRADREETIMIVKFGQEYVDYIERTDMFIPIKFLKGRR
jgi:methanethiol S-methyltransferase